jgi:SAM-dependent methyltransferase
MSRMLQRAMFEAPWWSIPINPHFLSRRALHTAMSGVGSRLAGRILDAGCGTQPYRQLLTHADHVGGLEAGRAREYAGKRIDVLYDGVHFPFADASFDGVVCNQVLEHVFMPEPFLQELRRVLVPGGTLVLSVPFAWPEHEQPWDSRRYTSFGLRDLLARCGFAVGSQQKLVGGAAAILALLADRVNRGAYGWPLPFRLLLRAIVAGPLSLVGWALMRGGASQAEFYLDNFVVARRTAD